MLIGGSEALGAMQISPALLRYPSVPLPVLFNPLIPPDWMGGGGVGGHICWFVASFPPPGMVGGTVAVFPWLAAGLLGPCHVQYIRGDQQASLKVRWHQAHAQYSLTSPPALPSSFFYPSTMYHLLLIHSFISPTCLSHQHISPHSTMLILVVKLEQETSNQNDE